MLTKEQVKIIRRIKPHTSQDYLILELLDIVEEAKVIMLDLRMLKNCYYDKAYRVTMEEIFKEIERFLEKYERD